MMGFPLPYEATKAVGMFDTPSLTENPAPFSFTTSVAADCRSSSPTSANSQIALLTAFSSSARRSTSARAVFCDSRKAGGSSARTAPHVIRTTKAARSMKLLPENRTRTE